MHMAVSNISTVSNASRQKLWKSCRYFEVPQISINKNNFEVHKTKQKFQEYLTDIVLSALYLRKLIQDVKNRNFIKDVMFFCLVA